jgi:Fic family protein
VGWGIDDESDPAANARALREAENGLRQARRVADLIRSGVPSGASPLTSAVIAELNGLAVDGIVSTAGKMRERSDLEISGSRHVVPSHDDVPGLIDAACTFVRDHWADDPILLASYVLWRICWIHPFDDGNGRTARAASYLVLCVRLGTELPGSLPVPARIKHAPIAYTRALEAADAAWARGGLDVSAMERLLAFYLDAQVRDAPPVFPP